MNKIPIFLLLVGITLINCKKQGNKDVVNNTNSSVSAKSITDDCLKEGDSLKVKELITDIQSAFNRKDSILIKSNINPSTLKKYTYERVESALEESLSGTEVIYEFRNKNGSGHCGRYNVLFITTKVFEEDGQQHFSENSVPFLVAIKNGKLKIIDLGFAG